MENLKETRGEVKNICSGDHIVEYLERKLILQPYCKYFDNNFDLNCEEFKDDIEKVSFFDDDVNYGKHYIFKFENGYGASVIKNNMSKGFDKDLWELAIIKFENPIISEKGFEIVYTTELTHTTVGDLTDKDVCEYLRKIKEIQ